MSSIRKIGVYLLNKVSNIILDVLSYAEDVVDAGDALDAHGSTMVTGLDGPKLLTLPASEILPGDFLVETFTTLGHGPHWPLLQGTATFVAVNSVGQEEEGMVAIYHSQFTYYSLPDDPSAPNGITYQLVEGCQLFARDRRITLLRGIFPDPRSYTWNPQAHLRARGEPS